MQCHSLLPNSLGLICIAGALYSPTKISHTATFESYIRHLNVKDADTSICPLCSFKFSVIAVS